MSTAVLDMMKRSTGGVMATRHKCNPERSYIVIISGHKTYFGSH